ncbi:hypothetical protein ACHAPA_011911 [Fusarium lateritium]
MSSPRIPEQAEPKEPMSMPSLPSPHLKLVERVSLNLLARWGQSLAERFTRAVEYAYEYEVEIPDRVDLIMGDYKTDRDTVISRRGYDRTIEAMDPNVMTDDAKPKGRGQRVRITISEQRKRPHNSQDPGSPYVGRSRLVTGTRKPAEQPRREPNLTWRAPTAFSLEDDQLVVSISNQFQARQEDTGDAKQIDNRIGDLADVHEEVSALIVANMESN